MLEGQLRGDLLEPVIAQILVPQSSLVGEETGDSQWDCCVTGQSGALLWLALETPCAHPHLPSHRGNKQLMVHLGSSQPGQGAAGSSGPFVACA